jgi:hypothetical protein
MQDTPNAITLTFAELCVRAAEFRALARMAPTPEARVQLTFISARYEKLAGLRAASVEGDREEGA